MAISWGGGPVRIWGKNFLLGGNSFLFFFFFWKGLWFLKKVSENFSFVPFFGFFLFSKRKTFFCSHFFKKKQGGAFFLIEKSFFVVTLFFLFEKQFHFLPNFWKVLEIFFRFFFFFKNFLLSRNFFFSLGFFLLRGQGRRFGGRKKGFILFFKNKKSPQS